MNKDIKRKWYRPLKSIIWILAIDIIAFFSAVIADTQISETSTSIGHGAPFVTTLVIIVFGGLTILTVAISVIKAVINLLSLNKECDINDIKPAKNYLWMIPVQVFIDAIVVVAAFFIDQANYEPLETGSFMFPIVMLCAIVVMAVITVVIIVISMLLTRFSQNRYERQLAKKREIQSNTIKDNEAE